MTEMSALSKIVIVSLVPLTLAAGIALVAFLVRDPDFTGSSSKLINESPAATPGEPGDSLDRSEARPLPRISEGLDSEKDEDSARSDEGDLPSHGETADEEEAGGEGEERPASDPPQPYDETMSPDEYLRYLVETHRLLDYPASQRFRGRILSYVYNKVAKAGLPPRGKESLVKEAAIAYSHGQVEQEAGNTAKAEEYFRRERELLKSID